MFLASYIRTDRRNSWILNQFLKLSSDYRQFCIHVIELVYSQHFLQYREYHWIYLTMSIILENDEHSYILWLSWKTSAITVFHTESHGISAFSIIFPNLFIFTVGHVWGQLTIDSFFILKLALIEWVVIGFVIITAYKIP